MSKSRTFSARLESSVAGRLDQRSAKTGQSRSRLADRDLKATGKDHAGMIIVSRFAVGRIEYS